MAPKEEEKKKEVEKKEKDKDKDKEKRKSSLLKMALSMSQTDIFRSASAAVPTAATASSGPSAGSTSNKSEKESLLSGRLLKKGFFRFRHKKAQSSLSLSTSAAENVSDCKELLELKAAAPDRHSNTSSSSSTITPGPAQGPSRASSQNADAASPSPAMSVKYKRKTSVQHMIPSIREQEIALPASGSQTPRASICSASSVSVSSSPRWSTRELYLETIARLLPSINLHSHVRSSGSDPHRAHEFENKKERERERKKSSTNATPSANSAASSGKGGNHGTSVGVGISMSKAPPSRCQSLASIEPAAIATASSSTSSASSHCTSNAVLARTESQQHCPDLAMPAQHHGCPSDDRQHLLHHYSPAEDRLYGADRNALAMQRRHNSVVDHRSDHYHQYKSILEDGCSEGDGCGGFSYSLAEDPSDTSVPEVEVEPESDATRKPHRALRDAVPTTSTSSSSSSQPQAASSTTPPICARSCVPGSKYVRQEAAAGANSAAGQVAGPIAGNPLTPQASAGDSGIDDASNSSGISLRLARQLERGSRCVVLVNKRTVMLSVQIFCLWPLA